MAQESANGSDPSNGASPNGSDPLGANDQTPFERFEHLTREILSAPKAELDKRREKVKRPQRRS